MTTQNTGGSAPAGNPSGGAAQGGNGGGNSTSVAPDAGFFSGLQDADNRNLVASKGWDKANSPDVVITSYRELESRLGKSVVLPSAEAPKDEHDKFYAALGRPEKPDGYAFKLPQGVPDNFPYDDGFATEYRNWAHEAGLNSRQAQNLHDRFVLRSVQQLQAGHEAMGAKVSKAHSEIVAKWGEEGSEGYKRNVEFASRALRKLGLSDVYKASGLLTQDGKITDAKVAFALATTGAGLYAEDGPGDGDPGSLIATNPWKEGAENLSEQGRITRENPQLARTLIKAAGKDPDKVLWNDGRGNK